MILQITYTDAGGYPLSQVTFNADDLRQAFERVLTVPSMHPPAGAVGASVVLIPPAQGSAQGAAEGGAAGPPAAQPGR